MSNTKTFLKSGHWPTLLASFLYFDFTFAIWVLNGAMGPFIKETYGLSPAQMGLVVSIPIIAGALMRFPLGVLSQYIGRKNAAMVEMGLIMLALLFGFFFVNSYDGVLAMGVLLGIAGGSFGVALSLGAGWFPPKYKGLAMGIAGAGNSGTVLAVLFAPPMAMRYGWTTVYGLAAATMLLPLAVMWFCAKEPPDREANLTLRKHVACLFEKDGWVFSLIYVVTFGGFIGLSSFLPSYFYDQFKVTKVEAGQLTMLATLVGSAVRVLGGHLADRWGGINTLGVVLLLVAGASLACGLAGGSVALTTALFMLCFAGLGLGNGALFQLVPLRWPVTTAVAGSMIGEIGALGGGILPNAMGLARQFTGSYFVGFLVFTGLALGALVMLLVVQRRWTSTWTGSGGRARAPIELPASGGAGWPQQPSTAAAS